MAAWRRARALAPAPGWGGGVVRGGAGQGRYRAGDGGGQLRVVTPGTAQEDLGRVGQGDHGGDRAGHRLGDGLAGGARGRDPGAGGGGRGGRVDGGDAGLAQAELAEDVDQADRPTVRADGEQVGDLAGQARVAAADLAVGDHGAAQALAQVEGGEGVQAGPGGGGAVGGGGRG